jgi:hypothetical protein
MSLGVLFFILNFSHALSVETFQQREKSFFDWQKQQENAAQERKNAAEVVRKERQQREAAAVLRRQQFRREYRTTSGHESEHLEKLERIEKNRLATRDVFSKNRQTLLNYYEKYMLPLKKKEYGLEELPKVESKKE